MKLFAYQIISYKKKKKKRQNNISNNKPGLPDPAFFLKPGTDAQNF
jgi:hypothetical protein